MNDPLEHIKAYLDSDDSDSALMIDGPWGCGKTYFFEKRVVPEIRSRAGSKGRVKRKKWWHIKSPGRKKMKPAYVSLYGLTKPEEIDRQVFFAVHRFAANRLSKAAAGMPKVAKVPWLDFSKLELDPRNWTNLQDVVLCFDDLERCSIKVGDMLGRINYYVEHKRVKTIILCNEDEIRTDKDEYKRIKEKVIGRFVRFRIDHGPVLDVMIDYYKANAQYHAFLVANRSLLLDLFRRSNSENIRILRHGLAHLQTAFEAIDSDAPYAVSARQAMIRLIMPITFEYELNELSAQDVADVATANSLKNVAWLLGKTGELPPTKKHEVKYFDVRVDFDPPSQAVADLITTGLLDRQLFRQELNAAYAPPGELDAATNSLFGNFWYLSDVEFKAHYDVLLAAVTNRKITLLPVYFRLCANAEFWADLHLIPMDRESLLKTLTVAVEDSVAAGLIDYDENLPDHLSRLTDVKPDVIRFRDFLLEQNEKLKRVSNEARGREFVRALCEASPDGIRKLVTEYFTVPIMEVLPVEEAVDALFKLPNKVKATLRSLLRKRYVESPPSATTRQEVEGLKRLHAALVSRLAKHTEAERPLGVVMLDLIASDLPPAIKRLMVPEAVPHAEKAGVRAEAE